MTVSLLAGVWLPMGATPNAADADGVCGQVLILEHSVQHFEATHPSAGEGHCVLCHWWNTMASASASSTVGVSVSSDPDRCVAGRPTIRPDVVVAGGAAPRAPPSAS